MTEFNYNSVMQVPRVEKITLNMGVGEAIADKNCWITQQQTGSNLRSKPLITKARKSVAGFKIRQGYPIGCKVTLRGERMWEFFERLITIAVPRIRGTSVACPLSLSTVVVTTAWVSVSRSSSQKSTTIKSTAFVVWILPLPLLRNLTKKAALCWLPLTSRSASKVGLLNG